jgi:hypothetical protein
MFTAYIDDQGYGWHIDEVLGHRRHWKGGGAPNYEYQVAWYPDDDFFIVIAMNDHAGWRVPVWSGIEGALFGSEPTLLPAVSGPAGPLGETLAGHYRTAGGQEVHLDFASPHLIYRPGEPTEGSRLPGVEVLFRQTSRGDLVGVGLAPGRPEVPLVRLIVENGSPTLKLTDGSAVALIPVAGS